MTDLLTHLVDAPLANLLILAGLVFLGIRRTSAYDLACSNTPKSFPSLPQSATPMSNSRMERLFQSEPERSRAWQFTRCSQLPAVTKRR